jgi:alcohol dehydrogenase
MKAVVYEKYGLPNVLKLTEVKKPQPKDDELLVKIHATTVTSGDVRLRASDFPFLFWLPARLLFGLFKPKKNILGHEFAGTVEKVGRNITKFKLGEKVFGTTTMLKKGAYAEYICLPQEWKHGVVELMPKNLNFKEATALPIGAMTAMYLLEKADLKKEQKILVYGASGSVGSYAVQIANQQGALITGVCSRVNFKMAKSLGIKSLIDYKTEDYSEKSEKFDVIFDAVGKTSKSKAKKVLNSKGTFVSVKMRTKEKSLHLKRIKELAENESIKSFIDRTFDLSEIVEAHQYVDTGRKRGNVIIEVTK